MTERVFPDVKFVDEPEPMPKGAELVYATDPASNEGDFTTAVGGYIDSQGVFHLQEVSVVRRNPQQRIKELRTKNQKTMKDYVLHAALILLAVVLVVNAIHAAAVARRIRRSVRETRDAVNAVAVGQKWRRTVRDYDSDPWTAPFTVNLRVEEIRYASNGDKWCRCVEETDGSETRLPAEELVDDYEQYE